MPLKTITHIAREFGPIAGAGGIKDVTWGLCRASAAAGLHTRLILPHYRSVDVYLKKHGLKNKALCTFTVPMDYGPWQKDEETIVSSLEIEQNLSLVLIKADAFRFLAEAPEKKIPRWGIYQYTEAEAQALERPTLAGQGYLDAFAQNVLHVKAALLTLGHMNWQDDLIHCHDGHTALFPFIAQAAAHNYADFIPHLPTLLSIHNAGIGYHQEIRSLDYVEKLCDLRGAHVTSLLKGCILDGAFDPLLAGSLFGNAVNTVSENYARELRETGVDASSAWLGHRLKGLGIQLKGITNGIDLASHDALTAEGLPHPFDVAKRQWPKKEACKKAILKDLTTQTDVGSVRQTGSLVYRKKHPLLTFVGRLTTQKGFDLLHQVLEPLLEENPDVQVWGLGSGDAILLKHYRALAERYEGRVCFSEGFDEALANRVYAAGDFFLIPSRFEPCGLTDFMAQLMGNLPIVHAIGGLVKTVQGQTGFSYLGGAEALKNSIQMALACYRSPGKKELHRLQVAAYQHVAQHFSWKEVLARHYQPLYQDIIDHNIPPRPY